MSKESVDLFDGYDKVTVEEVANHCLFLRYNTRDEDHNFITDMLWSGKVILNNMESHLSQKVREATAKIEPESIRQYGPLLLKIMLDHITCTSETHTDQLIKLVNEYEIKKITAKIDQYQKRK